MKGPSGSPSSRAARAIVELLHDTVQGRIDHLRPRNGQLQYFRCGKRSPTNVIREREAIQLSVFLETETATGGQGGRQRGSSRSDQAGFEQGAAGEG